MMSKLVTIAADLDSLAERGEKDWPKWETRGKAYFCDRYGNKAGKLVMEAIELGGLGADAETVAEAHRWLSDGNFHKAFLYLSQHWLPAIVIDDLRVDLPRHVVFYCGSMRAFAGLVRQATSTVPSEGGAAVRHEYYVTLLRVAGICSRSKDTLENMVKSGKIPQPDKRAPAKSGKAHEWKWSTLRPALEKEFGRNFPEIFPADDLGIRVGKAR